MGGVRVKLSRFAERRSRQFFCFLYVSICFYMVFLGFYLFFQFLYVFYLFFFIVFYMFFIVFYMFFQLFLKHVFVFCWFWVYGGIVGMVGSILVGYRPKRTHMTLKQTRIHCFCSDLGMMPGPQIVDYLLDACLVAGLLLSNWSSVQHLVFCLVVGFLCKRWMLVQWLDACLVE